MEKIIEDGVEVCVERLGTPGGDAIARRNCRRIDELKSEIYASCSYCNIPTNCQNTGPGAAPLCHLCWSLYITIAALPGLCAAQAEWLKDQKRRRAILPGNLNQDGNAI